MTWDQSTVIGPEPIPIYGAPTTDPNSGQTYTPITGYDGTRYCVLVTQAFLAAHPALAAWSQTQPAGTPDLQGTPTAWLVFPDEATAQAQPDLAALWTPDD